VYCFILSLRTVHVLMLDLRTRYRLTAKTTLFWHLRLHGEDKIQFVACTDTPILAIVSFVVFA